MVGAFSQVAVMILSVSDYFGRELTVILSHRVSRIRALTFSLWRTAPPVSSPRCSLKESNLPPLTSQVSALTDELREHGVVGHPFALSEATHSNGFRRARLAFLPSFLLEDCKNTVPMPLERSILQERFGFFPSLLCRQRTCKVFQRGVILPRRGA